VVDIGYDRLTEFGFELCILRLEGPCWGPKVGLPVHTFRRVRVDELLWHLRALAEPPERGTIPKMFTASERRKLWELSRKPRLDPFEARLVAERLGRNVSTITATISGMRRGLVPEKQGRLRWKGTSIA
jgi:hypothetical protein